MERRAGAIHLLADHQAGVVHQHLQIADSRATVDAASRAQASASHVQRVGQTCAPAAPTLGAGVGLSCFAEVLGDDDARAGVGTRQRRGAAYTAARAVTRRNLVFKQQDGFHAKEVSWFRRWRASDESAVVSAAASVARRVVAEQLHQYLVGVLAQVRRWRTVLHRRADSPDGLASMGIAPHRGCCMHYHLALAHLRIGKELRASHSPGRGAQLQTARRSSTARGARRKWAQDRVEFVAVADAVLVGGKAGVARLGAAHHGGEFFPLSAVAHHQHRTRRPGKRYIYEGAAVGDNCAQRTGSPDR